MRCDKCAEHLCGDGLPCMTRESQKLYQGTERKMMQAAAEVECTYYGDINRIEEIIEFSKRMGYRKLGIAFCRALSDEAAKIASILEHYFEISSVCCKVCGIPKESLDAPTSDRVGDYACNPIEQAKILEEAGTDLNIVLGLCVGHDALFIKHSHTYVVPLAAKDRRLGHNPLAAVYCSAIYKRMVKNAENQEK